MDIVEKRIPDQKVAYVPHIDSFSKLPEFIEEVGQSCGANIGPGLCCVYFFGKKITPERELENKIFQEFKNKK